MTTYQKNDRVKFFMLGAWHTGHITKVGDMITCETFDGSPSLTIYKTSWRVKPYEVPKDRLS